MNTSSTAKLLRSLQSGNSFTANQARTRFGFTSTDSVHAQFSKLRDRGFRVVGTPAKRNSNILKYTLAGSASKKQSTHTNY